MLRWWQGPDGSEQEPPETPGPVFVARAVKTALFGTPAPSDETLYEIQKAADSDDEMENAQFPANGASPTKPPGILLTPGTATARRKTVSFGTEVLDNEGNEPPQKAKSGATDVSGKLGPLSQPGRKTALTRTLENSRESKAGKERSTKKNDLPTPESLSPAEEKNRQMKGSKPTNKAEGGLQGNRRTLSLEYLDQDFNGDRTVDLNEPHSLSGKYWKSEFEQYHTEARAEMEKLVRYKQMAKSYAKKKDAEALDLAEKLKEEQNRVAAMEEDVAKLTFKNGDVSPQMMKELAQQTALARQYRLQVEEFRAALEGKPTSVVNETRVPSLHTDKNLPVPPGEARQLKEISSLREEMLKLRNDLSTVEKDNSKLREENNKLAQDLLHADLRLEKHTEKWEKRRRSSEEQRQKKDEALQALQKDYDTLKEQAKSQRRDAEHLLKKRHDQVACLKKEIGTLKGADSTIKDLQTALGNQVAAHEKVVEDYRKQVLYLEGVVLKKKPESPDKSSMGESWHLRAKSSQNESLRLKESNLPVPSPSVSKPSKAFTTQKSLDSPTGSPSLRAPLSALTDIENNANVERKAFQRSNKVERTPLPTRITDISLQYPMELPSDEPSPTLPTQTSHEKMCLPSPTKSFNLASSPPKPAMVRSRNDNESFAKGHSGQRPAVVSGHSLGINDSRARSTLPPERFAAAKARLELKNAEKKRAQSLAVLSQKENFQT